jgi:uncharacterized protein (DUF2252 family)
VVLVTGVSIIRRRSRGNQGARMRAGVQARALEGPAAEREAPPVTVFAEPTVRMGVEPPSPEERAARGKAARADVPRSSHAEWEPAPGRKDPVTLQEEAGKDRVQELLPIRYGRMLTSPFAFFRGTADIMAADLAPTPTTGFRAQLCGDAHLSNFGLFGSPERDLVFDINDFDETLPGPWEWDVKRLAASLALAGRDRGFPKRKRRDITRTAVRDYRKSMREFASMPELDVWYAHADVDHIARLASSRLSGKQVRRAAAAVDKARAKDSMRALRKLTRIQDGQPRIVSDPPLIVPIAELAPGAEREQLDAGIRALLDVYRASLPYDRRRLLERYTHVETARKVVGVGSVGTRVWIVLMVGRDAGDPLFLQCKEAGPSVLEPYAGKSRFKNHGRRVVEGQRLMQASSDIMLGWLTSEGIDGENRDFYVRQLWDWKGSVDVESMRASGLAAYGGLCGWTLARAHARTGDRIAIAAYLGKGDHFDRALVEFAERYADQSERDYALMMEAVRSGRLQADPEPV